MAWMRFYLLRNRKVNEALGDPDLKKIEALIRKTPGGFYDPLKSRGLPAEAREDALNNGAVFHITKSGLLYDYLSNEVTKSCPTLLLFH